VNKIHIGASPAKIVYCNWDRTLEGMAAKEDLTLDYTPGCSFWKGPR